MAEYPYHRVCDLWDDILYALQEADAYARQHGFADLHDRLRRTRDCLGELPASIRTGLTVEEVALDDEDARAAQPAPTPGAP